MDDTQNNVKIQVAVLRDDVAEINKTDPEFIHTSMFMCIIIIIIMNIKIL